MKITSTARSLNHDAGLPDLETSIYTGPDNLLNLFDLQVLEIDLGR